MLFVLQSRSRRIPDPLVRCHVTVVAAAGGGPAHPAEAATQAIPVVFGWSATPPRRSA
jgi:hypothetical protein